MVTRYEFARLVADAAGLGPEPIRRTSIAEAGLSGRATVRSTAGAPRGLLRTPAAGARECLGGGAG